MKFLLSCLCIVAFVENALSDTSDCPLRVQRLPHLKEYSDTCLLLVPNQISWDNARKSCRNMAGDLVQIKDADKQNFVLQSLNADHWNTDNIWIGCDDKKHEGEWRWVDGTKVTFNRFASGQGSNHNTGFLFADGRGEDCAVLRRDDGGRWHDYPCSPPVLGIGYKYTYICEFPKRRRSSVQPVTQMVTTSRPSSTTSRVETPAPTTMANVETPPPTTMPNVETPAPTTMVNVETPAPTTQANIETPPPTTQANIETPPPTTQANRETPHPTTQANIETPPPTTQANIETPPPTTQANIETPQPTTAPHTHKPHPSHPSNPNKETPPPTAIIGKKR